MMFVYCFTSSIMQRLCLCVTGIHTYNNDVISTYPNHLSPESYLIIASFLLFHTTNSQKERVSRRKDTFPRFPHHQTHTHIYTDMRPASSSLQKKPNRHISVSPTSVVSPPCDGGGGGDVGARDGADGRHD
jgi:hypothetical protein